MRRLLLAIIIILPINSLFAAPFIKIRLIDRGQADGILIETPNKKYVVIDAGTNKKQAAFMKDTLGIDEIELAVVTHRHHDHQGGMDEIIDAITTKHFLGIVMTVRIVPEMTKLGRKFQKTEFL